MLAEGGAPALVRPAALSDDGSAELVRAAVPEAMTALCRTCHALTGGNPFFLRELAGALREAGPDRAADVLGAAPDGVVAAVRARLARFPVPAQQLAGAAAVVGDGALIRHAAALADLDAAQAAEAADALRGGRILAESRALQFVHPIIRSAVHEQLSPAARSAGHERAARMLAAEDAAPERVAAHLLATEPRASEWVCDRLRDAAREAVPRGAPDASVTYLRRALEEPPSHDSRPAVLLELGLAESLTLDLEPAIEHLRRGVETTTDTVARLYAARTLAAIVGMVDPPEGVEILDRALAASPDADPALAVHIEAHLASIARFALTSRRATFSRAAATARARRGGRARRRAGALGRRHRGDHGRRVGRARRGAGGARDRRGGGRPDPGRRGRVRGALPDRGRPPRRRAADPLGDGRRRPQAAGQLPRRAAARVPLRRPLSRRSARRRRRRRRGRARGLRARRPAGRPRGDCRARAGARRARRVRGRRGRARGRRRTWGARRDRRRLHRHAAPECARPPAPRAGRPARRARRRARGRATPGGDARAQPRRGGLALAGRRRLRGARPAR